MATQFSSGWRVIAAASSYQRFHALADPHLLAEPRPSGSLPDAPALLASASVLCDASVNLVAIDSLSVPNPPTVSPAPWACVLAGPSYMCTYSGAALDPGDSIDMLLTTLPTCRASLLRHPRMSEVLDNVSDSRAGKGHVMLSNR